MTTSEEKRVLIETALEKLQSAHALDEREFLTVEKWTGWYDATIPLVHDIGLIAAAMEVELAKRRGQQLVARGESRAGQHNLSGSERLSHAQEIQRSNDRTLGRDPAAVDEYIQTVVKAGRKPTRHGAVHHVKQKRKAAGAKNLIRPVATVAAQTRSASHYAQIIAAVDRLADGRRRADPELKRVIGSAPDDFLRFVRFLPWLVIDRTAAGTQFTIDQQLRTLCDTWQPRPELGGESLGDFFANLRATITRKRKENHDERGKRRWSTESTNQAEQTRLLDYVETELDRVPLLAPKVPRRHITVAGGSHVSSLECPSGTLDPRAG